MNKTLRLLRYNTATDKKSFLNFNENFDATIFNASILAYYVDSITDLIVVYENRFIIDPQTHIFQNNKQCISSKDGIKKSVEKYFENLPKEIVDKYIEEGVLDNDYLLLNIQSLVKSSYEFQTRFINEHIENKDYAKYLNFVNKKIEANKIIAPYLMIKNDYSINDVEKVLEFNIESVILTKRLNKINNIDISSQLMIDKKMLLRDEIIDKIVEKYKNIGIEYLFVWIDDFDTFSATKKENKSFKSLIMHLNNIGIKPIMSYGGYDSILLCNNKSKCKLYGVAQSIGYGEKRDFIPVGGGLPVNKFYFFPLHERLKMNETIDILMKNGYIVTEDKSKEAARRFYSNICNCKQCRKIIKDDINNFRQYNDSTSFIIKNQIKRNRPTYDAAIIANEHFMYCKVKEWKDVFNLEFSELKKDLLDNYAKYNRKKLAKIEEWSNIYE